MEIIKIKRTDSLGTYNVEYEILTFQIDENGKYDRGRKLATCEFCKKIIKPFSIAYDWKGEGYVKGGYVFCAKTHLKNWLKIRNSR